MAAESLGKLTLYDAEKPLYFGPGGQEAFLQALAVSEGSQTSSLIRREEDVLLTRKGRTVSGERYSRYGLASVCSALGPFLWDFLREWDGADKKLETTRDQYSPEEAIQIFNTVVRRRFKSRLLGKSFVKRSGLIQRVASGPSTGRLALPLFSGVSESVEKYAKTLVFFEGLVAGDQASAKWRRITPYFSLKAPDGWDDHWYEGYCFRNSASKVRGTAVHGVVCRERDWSSFLTDSLKGLPVRIEDRYAALAQSVGTRNEPHPRLASAKDLHACMLRLRETRLGLGLKDDEAETKARLQLCTVLFGRECGHKAIRAALAFALRYGSYDDVGASIEASPAIRFRSVSATRTLYDMCNAMAREAKLLSHAAQMMFERRLYQICLNPPKI